MSHPFMAKGASDKIRVGVIGMGGRGCRAGITDCASADSNIELIAMGDLFKDHLDGARGQHKSQLCQKEFAL